MSSLCGLVLNPIQKFLSFSLSSNRIPSTTREERAMQLNTWQRVDTLFESRDKWEYKRSLCNNSTISTERHSKVCCDRTTCMTCYMSEHNSHTLYNLPYRDDCAIDVFIYVIYIYSLLTRLELKSSLKNSNRDEINNV